MSGNLNGRNDNTLALAYHLAQYAQELTALTMYVAQFTTREHAIQAGALRP